MLLDFITSKIGGFVAICLFLSASLLAYHRHVVNAEDAKIQAHTQIIINAIREKKDALNSGDHSNSVSIKRLLSGTF
jgi:hypothetical protein